MEVKIEAKLTQKEMFSFLMKHSYSSFGGFVGVLLSICAFIGFFTYLPNPNIQVAYKLVLLLTGLLFTVIQPLMLYQKAGKQIKKNTSFANAITYVFNERLIEVSQDEAKISFEWNEITKVTTTKKLVIIYLGKVRAFVLPKSAIGDRLNDLEDLIRKYSAATLIHWK
ncbi:MAG: YcxB family protein [Lachnospiraceae bacterium]|nr:YcxB family protein [Lachnospiraceae bacterium]